MEQKRRFEGSLTTFPYQNRGGRNRHLFGKILGGKRSRDVDGDLITLEDNGGGVDFEVDVLNRLDHFGQAAAREKGGGEHCGK